MNNQVLITGGSGFIGRALLKQLTVDQRWRPVVAVRSNISDDLSSFNIVEVPGLSTETDWESALSGISVVIHLAARVHVMKDSLKDPLAEFRKVNVEGTLRLASQAAESGVKRFIFISTIKVNGESTDSGNMFTADDIPNPLDDYAISKSEAELGLMKIGHDSGMDVVIIRPPLVYGPGVKGNFLTSIEPGEQTLSLYR
jgi:nucleoside-diphosphate-sugar epimerase